MWLAAREAKRKPQSACRALNKGLTRLQFCFSKSGQTSVAPLPPARFPALRVKHVAITPRPSDRTPSLGRTGRSSTSGPWRWLCELFSQIESRSATVDGRNAFRTTLKPWESSICWYLQSHHSRVACVRDFVHPQYESTQGFVGLNYNSI